MSPAQLIVTVIGAAAIVWELWYFLGPRRRPAPSAAAVPAEPEPAAREVVDG